MENTTKNNDYMLPASILIAAVLIAGSIFFVLGDKNPDTDQASNDQLAAVASKEEALKLGDRDVILGNPDAPVTIIEYGDFQCPWCSKFFAEVEGPLRDNYIQNDKVKMVYRNFAFLGPESFAAAEAAECAKDQSKFWAFHDALYELEHKDGQEHNGNLNRELFLQIATDNEFDINEFTTCIDSGKYTDKIKSDTDLAQLAGVNGTPALFVNGQQVGGFVTYAQLSPILDQIIGAN